MDHNFSFAQKRDAYEQVVQFVEEHQKSTISSCHQKIDADLGISGDDNLELIEAFVEKFDLDPAGYDHEAHFLSEGEGSPNIIFGLFIIPLLLWINFWLGVLFGVVYIPYAVYMLKQMRSPDEVSDMRIKDMIRWHLHKTYQLQETTNDK